MHDLRQEALLNEYKGNLFEYLVGQSLARHFNLEIYFLENITSDFRLMLTQQEQFIRTFYPTLLTDLPKLALGLTSEVINQLSLSSVDHVSLVGKAAMAAHNARYSEADILIVSGKMIVPLSVKICKANSFVNTKSAGLKSFFTKYFNAPQIQNAFDDETFRLIEQLTYDLNDWADIATNENFEQWIKLGLPQLPGQLPLKAREIYLQFIIQLNKKLYDYVKKIFQANEHEFANSLMPLLGFSHENIIQATTFYQNKDNHYELKQHLVDAPFIFKNQITFKQMAEFRPQSTNFEIEFQDRVLQLRIKAMNKFTSRSYKINCSVKKIK
jgi:hypothetical protein